MSRLPAIDPEAMSLEQRQVYDDIISGPRGKLQGPFNSWLRSPELCSRAQLLGEFCRFNSSLPPRLSELAILTVARHMTCQVEWYLHEPIARNAGISTDIIEAIKERQTPEFANDDERAIYTVVKELIESHRMSDGAYSDALAHFDECGIVDLVGIVGYYIFVALTLNGFEILVPDTAEPPLTY